MIMKLSPDRLLAPFYEAVGKEPLAPRYGGWEAKGISGHTLGHYLTAMSKCYKWTGNTEAKKRAEYVVETLLSLQSENGYICGFPEKESFSKVFENKEDFTVDGFYLAGWWVPYYTLHKILRGLIDAFKLAGIENALTVASRLGEWVYSTTSALSSEQRKRLMMCEYGGMNSALAELYLLTNNEHHKSASLFFCEEDLLLPLSRKEDVLTGKHANTQIPKIIGAVDVYNAGGDGYLLESAKFFFEQVANNRSYVIGGHSVKEHFHDLETEPLETNTCETCNSNNMLTLGKKLFELESDSRYYDICERIIYNHILASQEETGMKTYFVGLKPGCFKVYSTPEDSFWCCFGSGLENPFTYNEHIYSEKDGIYVNLFIPSTLETENISLCLETDFPNSENAVITVLNNADETVYIRKPCWCKNFCVEFNGKIYNETQNGYVKIKAQFKAGDKINISLPCEFDIYRKRDNEKSIAYLYGPIVLAQCLGNEKYPESDFAKGENDLTDYEGITVSPLEKFEMPVKTDGEMTFLLKDNNIVLKPFYSVHHERYTVYYDLC